MDFKLDYYTPDGSQNLLSKRGVLTLLGTGIAVGGVWGVAKVIGTESQSKAQGALDAARNEF